MMKIDIFLNKGDFFSGNFITQAFSNFFTSPEVTLRKSIYLTSSGNFGSSGILC